jgi:AraC-like DNA-binding protein
MMEIGLNILLVGAVQGILLSVFLASSHRGIRNANIVLAILIAAVSCTMIINYYYIKYPGVGFNDFLFWLDPCFPFYGFLIFLYAKYFVGSGHQAGNQIFYAAIPAAIKLISWIFPGSEPDGLLSLYHEHGTTISRASEELIFWGVELGCNLSFTLAAIAILRRYRKKLFPRQSGTKNSRLTWLVWLVGFSVFIWIVEIGNIFLVAESRADFRSLFLFSYGLVTIVFYCMGYIGLRYPDFFTQKDEGKSKSVIGKIKKYAKSSLSDEMAKSHLSTLRSYMKNERPYLQSALKLRDLAHKMEISSNHLSQVINDQLGQNFFDFVNSYRVQEAKRLLKDPEYKHLTLIAVAFDAGFNSKTTFNTAFKKHTNLTPSEYQRRFRQA